MFKKILFVFFTRYSVRTKVEPSFFFFLTETFDLPLYAKSRRNFQHVVSCRRRSTVTWSTVVLRRCTCAWRSTWKTVLQSPDSSNSIRSSRKSYTRVCRHTRSTRWPYASAVASAEWCPSTSKAVWRKLLNSCRPRACFAWPKASEDSRVWPIIRKRITHSRK